MKPMKTTIDDTIINRMSDVEYIEYLEENIKRIANNVNTFINLMDKSIFGTNKVTDKPFQALQTYADNVSLLQD